MNTNYVSKTLNEFMNESKSITLKRKYGERPTISAGTNAPLRNQVLSYVAESGSVSKIDLKKFILGLKEEGSTPAAANMFIKRNAKYFITESRNGITYFKLSNLGQRLVNHLIPKENANLSESFKNKRRMLNERMVEDDQIDGRVEVETSDEIDVPDEIESPENIEAGDIDGEGPADEIEFPEDGESGELENEPKDLELEVEELKERVEELEEMIKELLGDEDVDKEPESEPEIEPEIEPENELEPDSEDEDNLEPESEDEERKFDFKDKGRPGIYDMDESMKAQFVSHNLTGKKSPNLGGKLDPKLHNLLTNTEVDDDISNFENEITEKSQVAPKLGGKLKDEYHDLLDADENKDENELDEDFSASKEQITEAQEKKMKKIIANLKSVNEAQETDPKDELSDADLDATNTETPEETTDDQTATTLGDDQEMEKVEITEFIITVADVDAAIEELANLGVTAEKVPIEKPIEEVPAAEETPTEETPTEETPAPEETATQEAFKKFVKGILNEQEDLQQPDDLGSSDELGLGDQGENATELETSGEEAVEPTQEFEENKIKVKAEDWDILKGWLEEKGVDIKEMFGGDIETEEVSPEEAAAEEQPTEEIPDEEIDFSGIGNEDKTKVKGKEAEESK